MNYVEQTEFERRAELEALSRRNWVNPANVPIPAGGPVKLAEITPEQLDAMTKAIKRQNPSVLYSVVPRDWFSSQLSVDLKFTGDGPARVEPAVDYQALAAFRADVIETLQREIAALKLDRDAKLDAARGLRDMVREKVYPEPVEGPTMGEVLANALARCDSVTTAYGR